MALSRQIVPGFMLAAASVAQADGITPSSMIDTYGNIAQAGYTDALTTAMQLHDSAMQLHDSVVQLTEAPSEKALSNAREAWQAARVPYQQTEVYRFGNSLVDDWESRVNLWPLDEGLIDYVDASFGNESEANEFYTANIVANSTIAINGQTIDASSITSALLSEELQEAGGIESNVAIGYHAIEFLLWGQDLNGGKAGAGNRPYTDYDVNNCTHDNCDRRAEYLKAVTDLLVSDLTFMAQAWDIDGDARAALKSKGDTGAVAASLAMHTLQWDNHVYLI